MKIMQKSSFMKTMHSYIIYENNAHFFIIHENNAQFHHS